MHWRKLHPALLLAVASSLLACNQGVINYEAKFSHGFSPDPTTVSIFGIYDDGRMSSEAWGQVEARIAPVLGKPSCDSLYGQRLRKADPELFEAVERSAVSEGITDDLLDRFSSAAEGDAIMVISVRVRSATGKPPTTKDSGTLLGGRNGPGPAGRTPGAPPAPLRLDMSYRDAEIRLSATLFSAKQHVSMGRLTMIYNGVDLDDALQKFAARMGEALAGSVCKGWTLGEP